MKKILVMGSFVTDIVTTMDEFPQAGESIVGKSLNTYLGGKGLNQCISIARLGGEVEMIGSIGNDVYGKKMLGLLEEEHVRHDGVIESADQPTGLSQVQINAHGQNRICMVPGANLSYDFSDLERAKNRIEEAEIVLFQLEMRLDVTFEAIKYAKSLGKTIILNPAPAAPIPDEVLGCVDFLTPNETELAKLSGKPVATDIEGIEESCKILFGKGAKNIVTTLGDKGCYFYSQEEKFFAEGYKVKAVDTVAAGDSFNGALTVKIAEGVSIREAIKFANAMGALTVQKKGAIPSIHKRIEVEKFLAEVQ